MIRRRLQIFSLTLLSLTFAPSAEAAETAPADGSAWAERIGGIAADLVFAAAADSDGNVYTIGTFLLVTDVGAGEIRGAGDNDILVTKHDPAGELLWARAMGGRLTDEPRAAAVDSDGNLYITGYFLETADFGREPGEAMLESVGGADAFVVKLSPQGDTLWARSWGGKFADGGTALAIADDGLYVGGRFQQTVNFGSKDQPRILTSAGLRDGFVLKLDAGGEPVSAFRFGGDRQDEITGLAADGAGNVFVAGTFDSTIRFGDGAAALSATSGGVTDVFLARLDPHGKPAWLRHVGGSQVDRAAALRLGADGDLWLVGSFQGSLRLGADEGAQTLTSAGVYDVFASRWSGDGTLVWARRLGGAAAELALAADLDAEGLVIAGSFQEEVDFAADGSTPPLASVDGTVDGFVVILDRNDGTTLRTLRFGSEGAEQVTAVTSAPGHGLRLAGMFNKTLRIGALGEPLSSAGKTDHFLIRPPGPAGSGTP